MLQSLELVRCRGPRVRSQAARLSTLRRESSVTADRSARRPVISLLAVQLLHGMLSAAGMGFLSIYVTDGLGYATVVAAAIVSVGQATGAITAIAGGGLNDSAGRRTTLLCGYGCFVVGSLAFSACVPWLIGLLWMVNGVGLTLSSLGGQGYLIAAGGGVPGGVGLGVWSALYNWGFTLGGALGSPVAGYVLDHHGYGLFSSLVVALAAAALVLALLLLPRLPNDGGQQAQRWHETLTGYLRVVGRSGALRLLALRFLPTCYYGMAVVLVPLLINGATGSKMAVASYRTLNLVLATLSQLVVGRAADRSGPRQPTVAALSGVVVAAVGLTFTADRLWGLFVFGVLGGAAAWSLSTLMPSMVSASTPAGEQGRVLGALMLSWNLAMVLSAMVGGALVDAGAGTPFAIAAVLNVGAITLAVVHFR